MSSVGAQRRVSRRTAFAVATSGRSVAVGPHRCGLRAAVQSLVLLCLLSSLAGCASFDGLFDAAQVAPARVSSALEQSAGARRASLRLVMDGLDDDAAGDAARARASYERALQVDPSNPYAYLALARHWAESFDPERAYEFLDRAEALFEAQGALDPGVQVHLTGLRGEILRETGHLTAAFEDLERARNAAPVVWEDGHLSAEELR